MGLQAEPPLRMAQTIVDRARGVLDHIRSVHRLQRETLEGEIGKGLLALIGVVFFASGLLQAVSFLAAVQLSGRFGLLRTMGATRAQIVGSVDPPQPTPARMKMAANRVFTVVYLPAEV